jgi:peptide/nickel transport system permease protein
LRTYVIRRLLLFFPTIFGVSLVVFVILRIVPGDPAFVMLAGYEGEGTFTEADLERVRINLGLNDPIAIQYVKWVGGALRLDFGDSFFTNRPIWDEVRPRLPLTLQFAFMAISLAIVFALPMGVISAVRQDTWADYGLRVFSIIGLAMPTFWVAALVILALSLWFNWIPPLGYVAPWEDPWKNFVQLIFPAVALAYSTNAVTARITRSQMLEVLREDYVRTALAKGLRERVVIYRHALKNASLPVITLFGVQFAALLGGSVVVESVFSLPGIGRLLIFSINTRDFPMIQFLVTFIAFIFLSVNLIIDLLYGWLDPRIRYD